METLMRTLIGYDMMNQQIVYRRGGEVLTLTDRQYAKLYGWLGTVKPKLLTDTTGPMTHESVIGNTLWERMKEVGTVIREEL